MLLWNWLVGVWGSFYSFSETKKATPSPKLKQTPATLHFRIWNSSRGISSKLNWETSPSLFKSHSPVPGLKAHPPCNYAETQGWGLKPSFWLNLPGAQHWAYISYGWESSNGMVNDFSLFHTPSPLTHTQRGRKIQPLSCRMSERLSPLLHKASRPGLQWPWPTPRCYQQKCNFQIVFLWLDNVIIN